MRLFLGQKFKALVWLAHSPNLSLIAAEGSEIKYLIEKVIQILGMGRIGHLIGFS